MDSCLALGKELAGRLTACGSHSAVHRSESSSGVAFGKRYPFAEPGTFPVGWHSSCSSCAVQPWGAAEPVDFAGIALEVAAD